MFMVNGLRNRIVGHRRVKASDLAVHPLNFRTHSLSQRQALNGVLREVGFSRSLLVYVADADKSRENPPLTLLDGHLRREEVGDSEVDVEVLDLNDAEANKLLASLDAIAGMAGVDDGQLEALLSTINPEDDALRNLMLEMQGMVDTIVQPESESAPHPEMELQAYEHYDYVLVLARTTIDFKNLCEKLGVEMVNSSTVPGKRKIGLGRCIDANRVLERLK